MFLRQNCLQNKYYNKVKKTYQENPFKQFDFVQTNT